MSNRTEYTQETSVGQLVTKINLNILLGKSSKTTTTKEGLFIEKMKIVCQTPIKLALSNDWISVFDRQKKGEKKESYNHYLEDIIIEVRLKDDLFTTGIFAICHTAGDVGNKIKLIKGKIIEKINEEYSFLVNDDLLDKIYEMEVGSK